MMRRWLILVFAAWPLFAQEAVTPDTIAAQSGYTDCTLAEIDEDPDSSGTDWCDVSDANNVTTEARATFNTPSGNPSGTQEFRVQLRKTSQSTDPSCRVDLYENGTEVTQSVIADTAISTTSEVVLSGTWSAASLGTADGSLVEIYVLCTPGGGNPNNRASGEVGAVEWVATVASAPVQGAAALTAGLTVSGTGEEIIVGSGAITPSLAVQGTGEEIITGGAASSSALSLSSDSVVIVNGAAEISPVLAVSATAGSSSVSGAAQISSALTLDGSGVVIVGGASEITPSLSLGGDGLVIVGGTSALSSSLGVSASGEEIVVGSGTISASLSASVYTGVPVPTSTIDFPVSLPNNIRIGP